MRIKKARQILKSFADDTRLRIINLLNKGEMNVSEICDIVGFSQSNISKHLSRLRLTGVVSDKRKGLNVYYYLRTPENRAHRELVNAITKGLSGLEVFERDIDIMRKIRKKK